MIIKRYYSFILVFCFWLAACNVTKSLPEGEKLYTGATVKLDAPNLKSKQKKVFQADLQGLTRPRPNSRFLGIPFKLMIYTAFRNAKPKSFFGKFRDKNGQPPVLLSSVDLEQNEKVLESHLENKGFFKATIEGDTTAKAKRGSATYDAQAGHQYVVDSIQFPNDTSQLSQAIQKSLKETLLKPGAPFDLDLIKGERLRIDNYLKERGFYYFSPDHLLAQVDSTDGQHTVDMRFVIKPETPDEATQPYRINNVYIYSSYRLNAASADTSKEHAKLYEGFYVVDRRNRFKPSMFTQVMQFNPGDLYNRTDHNQTLNRLINLNEFKFVKNRFEPVEDTTKLDVYYYLTPLKKKSLRAEITGTSTDRSNSINGSQITLSWKNRNTFRGGEHLALSANIGSEIQYFNRQTYTTYRAGAEMNFAIPRFIIPFFDVRTRGGYVPRTNIQLGYDILNRRKLYTLNSFRGGIGYLWKENIQKQHEFYPISITYVQPVNVTPEYRDSVNKHSYLARAIDSQFVIGSTYQYNLNQLATGVQKTNSFYFNGLVDLSGNLAGLVVPKKEGADKARIFNAAFDQYVKLEADFRYYRRFGANATWANRIIVGYGIPYGNSEQLPYIKQFFAGGNNSIRAFRSRSLLGSSLVDNKTGFFPDQTGDMKLELNTEYRPKISGPLYGALFIDAGNVWLKNEDPERPGAKFSNQFLKDLAVGVGAGMRLDIQIFVLRLDVAFPVRKPWEDNPWVINQVRIGKAEWRRENVVYNIAIGYPF